MIRNLALLAILAVPVLCGVPALAVQPQTGEPAEAPKSNRYMKYKNPKAFVVKTQYYIRPLGLKVVEFDETAVETFDQIELVLPYVTASGNSWTTTQQAGYPNAEINVDFREGSHKFEAVPGRVAGTQAPYMIYKSPAKLEVYRLQVVQTNALVCAETVFDERAAWDVPWPSQWPAEISGWLERDAVFDLDDEKGVDQVKVLLDRWTGGSDPRQVPPVQLTKFLTGKVLDHVRDRIPPIVNPRGVAVQTGTSDIGANQRSRTVRSGSRSVFNGMIGGLNVQDAGKTAVSGEGSPHDYNALLTALLRRVGIPARTVIGIDNNESSESKQFKSWVEFALVAPDVDRVIWVPIDTWELRSSGRNSRSWQQPWKHFGTSEELAETLPVAFYFHPPVNYRTYATPCLYGIRARSELSSLGIQGMIGGVSSQPNRGGN